mmetsp:Transcript_110962/g.220702  ORF Transcript_110962/g.220702 Transcript_110962/m.220702 type:complete len:321 (-) Transcript_110962:582-1544(-)
MSSFSASWQRDSFNILDSQYQQQTQGSWAAGRLREPSPEATGGEQLQEEVRRLRIALAAERHASEEKSSVLQELRLERQSFREELFRVRTELESLLEAKERLLKAKEADCSALQAKLQVIARHRSPMQTSSASSPTRDCGADATNYHDKQLWQVMAERDKLRERLKSHEEWHDEIMKNVDEVERTHSKQKELQRALEHMHQELQRTRLERDEALSQRGCEDSGSRWINGRGGSVRDGREGSGRASSWDGRGRVNNWDGSSQDDGRDGSSRLISAPIVGCAPGGCSAAGAYIVEDPHTPAPLVRSKSSWMHLNSTKHHQKF